MVDQSDPNPLTGVDASQLRRAAARLADLRDRLAASADSTQAADSGLAGWSCESVLSRLGDNWAVAVRGLAAGYADHAEELRAVADQYGDAARIVSETLGEEPW